MQQPAGPRNPLFLREEDLERSLELLFGAQAALTRALHGPLAQAGLDEAGYLLLFLIRRRPGLTGAALVQFTGWPKQNLSRRLGELEQRGLVTREVDPLDRRRRPLRITDLAEQLLEGLLSLQKRPLRRVFRRLGPAAVEGFKGVLSDLASPEGRVGLVRPNLREDP